MQHDILIVELYHRLWQKWHIYDSDVFLPWLTTHLNTFFEDPTAALAIVSAAPELWRMYIDILKSEKRPKNLDEGTLLPLLVAHCNISGSGKERRDPAFVGALIGLIYGVEAPRNLRPYLTALASYPDDFYLTPLDTLITGYSSTQAPLLYILHKHGFRMTTLPANFQLYDLKEYPFLCHAAYPPAKLEKLLDQLLYQECYETVENFDVDEPVYLSDVLFMWVLREINMAPVSVASVLRFYETYECQLCPPQNFLQLLVTFARAAYVPELWERLRLCLPVLQRIFARMNALQPTPLSINTVLRARDKVGLCGMPLLLATECAWMIPLRRAGFSFGKTSSEPVVWHLVIEELQYTSNPLWCSLPRDLRVRTVDHYLQDAHQNPAPPVSEHALYRDLAAKAAPPHRLRPLPYGAAEERGIVIGQYYPSGSSNVSFGSFSVASGSSNIAIGYATQIGNRTG